MSEGFPRSPNLAWARSAIAIAVDDDDFTYEKMISKSAAAANLANWVINTFRFNRIYVRVKPLMNALEEAQKAGQAAEIAAAIAAAEKVAMVNTEGGFQRYESVRLGGFEN